MRFPFAVRVSGIYAIFAALWIIASDLLLVVLTRAEFQPGQTIKGLLFISLTTALIYFLVSRGQRAQSRTEAQLESSERRLRLIASQMPLILWTTDLDLCVTGIIGGDLPLLTGPPEAYTGKNLSELLDAGNDNAGAIEAHQRALRGESADYEYLSNRGFFFRVRVEPLLDESGQITGSLSVALDLTDRQRMQEAERDQRVMADALRDVAASLTGTLDRDEVLDRILDNLIRVVPHDAANIMQASDTGWTQVVKHRGYQERDLEDWINNVQHDFANMPKYREMAQTGQPVVVPDIQNYAEWVQAPEMAWVRSYAAAPIFREGRLQGFLNLYSATPGLYDERAADRLRAFANQAGIALTNAELWHAITRHAQELEQRVEERTAALLHEKERVEAILRGSSDVILFLRDDGRVAQANPAFAATFGCPVEDILEQPVLTLTTPTYTHLLGQALNSVIRLRKPARLEIAAVCNSSSPFDADFALSPVTYDNRLVGVVCTVRDVSPQKQVEAQLRQTLAREMQLGEMRARFISMASHEFRNPLAVILASVSLLESYADRMDPEMTKRKFDQIRLQIAYLTELLNDVLLYTKNEMGRIEFEPEPGRIDLLCGEMVDNMRYAIAEEHQIEFTTHGSFPLLQIDPKLLRQIVGNLVSNALKYSRTGSTIRIELVSRERDILLRVADEGIGIPAASQSQVFEAFHRAENALNIPGTGLGLAIVKQAAELHGGSITFVSEEGRGTTFEVVLPQIPVQEEEVSPPAASSESH